MAAGVLGLLTGNHRIAFYTSQSNIITLGYFTEECCWMVRRWTPIPPRPGCAAR